MEILRESGTRMLIASEIWDSFEIDVMIIVVTSVKFLTGSSSALLRCMVAKPFIFFLVLRFHKIRQRYEKISTSVQVATHNCHQQNSNFHPILGESGLRLILLYCFFFFQPLNVNR